MNAYLNTIAMALIFYAEGITGREYPTQVVSHNVMSANNSLTGKISLRLKESRAANSKAASRICCILSMLVDISRAVAGAD